MVDTVLLSEIGYILDGNSIQIGGKNSEDGAGGDMTVLGGAGVSGGGAVLGGGQSSTGDAGLAYVAGGNSSDVGSGGQAFLVGGNSVSGAGGDCKVAGGNGFTDGGDLTLSPGIGVGANGNILIQNIPSADPEVVGALWIDGTTLKISAG